MSMKHEQPETFNSALRDYIKLFVNERTTNSDH